MVRPYLEVISQQVYSPLLYGMHDCQELFFMGGIVLFSIAEFTGGIRDGLVSVSLVLGEHASYRIVRGVSGDGERVFWIWTRDSQHRSCAHPFLEFLERLLRLVIPLERSVFACEGREGGCYLRVAGDKSAVIVA